MSDDDKKKSMVLEGLKLEADEGDEPRVSAFDIAERAGKDHKRGVKTLLKAMVERGEIEEPAMRSRLERIVKTGAKGVAGVEEREVEEPMLDEEQAVLLVMNLRTTKAVQLRRLVAKVFVAWRKQELESVRMECAAAHRLLEAQTAVSLSAVVGRSNAKQIQGQLRVIAATMAAARGDLRSKASCLKQVDQELRQRVGFPASGGMAWEMLPSSKHADAIIALANIRHREDKELERSERARQCQLPGVKETPAKEPVIGMRLLRPKPKGEVVRKNGLKRMPGGKK